jgi:hypothetical protein
MSKTLLQGLQSRCQVLWFEKSEKDVTDKRTVFLWGQEEAVLGTMAYKPKRIKENVNKIEKNNKHNQFITWRTEEIRAYDGADLKDWVLLEVTTCIMV